MHFCIFFKYPNCVIVSTPADLFFDSTQCASRFFLDLLNKLYIHCLPTYDESVYDQESNLKPEIHTFT